MLLESVRAPRSVSSWVHEAQTLEAHSRRAEKLSCGLQSELQSRGFQPLGGSGAHSDGLWPLQGGSRAS